MHLLTFSRTKNSFPALPLRVGNTAAARAAGREAKCLDLFTPTVGRLGILKNYARAPSQFLNTRLQASLSHDQLNRRLGDGVEHPHRLPV